MQLTFSFYVCFALIYREFFFYSKIFCYFCKAKYNVRIMNQT